MRLLPLVLALSLAACQASPGNFAPQGARPAFGLARSGVPSNPISHVVIVIQENRTPDNLFHCLPHTDTCPTYGLGSGGQHIGFHQRLLTWTGDMSHTHATFSTEYDGGRMDGFNLAQGTSSACKGNNVCAYAFVPQSEVQPYWTMAQQYTFADRMFQTNQGPSYPAHFEFVTGTAAVVPVKPSGYYSQFAENPQSSLHGSKGGCDSPSTVHVPTIPTQPIGAPEGNPVFPCITVPTLASEIDKAGLTWRYYVHRSGPGLWNPFDAIKAVRYSQDWNNVVTPSQTILTDISNNRLPSVVWVTPDGSHSDHSGSPNGGGGPSWVAAVVNAIGQSKYWNSTAIFVTWDDWGGWYDHVAPRVIDNYDFGLRVPLLVISPYAKSAYVSETPHQFGSILRFTEETFGLSGLGANDAPNLSDDLSDCFDFAQFPRPFHVIPAPPFYPAAGLSSQREDP